MSGHGNNGNNLETKAKPRYGMLIDLRRCIGCHACSVACKSENDVRLGVFRSWVKVIEKGTYPHVRKVYLPLLCNNCERAVCLSVCPVKATWRRDDGIIMIDEHRCIGCKYCMAACPYDVRHVNPIKKIVQKCYWCFHRVDAGLVPSCVNTCQARARIFGDLHDPESEISKLLATNAVQVLKAEKATEPRVYYIGLDEVIVKTKAEEA